MLVRCGQFLKSRIVALRFCNKTNVYGRDEPLGCLSRATRPAIAPY